jgi:hypothetical protein
MSVNGLWDMKSWTTSRKTLLHSFFDRVVSILANRWLHVSTTFVKQRDNLDQSWSNSVRTDQPERKADAVGLPVNVGWCRLWGVALLGSSV